MLSILGVFQFLWSKQCCLFSCFVLWIFSVLLVVSVFLMLAFEPFFKNYELSTTTKIGT